MRSTNKDSYRDPNLKAALVPYHPNAPRSRLPVHFQDEAKPFRRFCKPRNEHSYECASFTHSLYGHIPAVAMLTMAILLRASHNSYECARARLVRACPPESPASRAQPLRRTAPHLRRTCAALCRTCACTCTAAAPLVHSQPSRTYYGPTHCGHARRGCTFLTVAMHPNPNPKPCY